MYAKLREVGGVEYTPEEQVFAEQLYPSLKAPTLPLGSQAEVQEFDYRRPGIGSTDVADVSWNVPTVGLRTATWVPGTPAHSWQAVAAGGTSIGHKGMTSAAQTLALTGAELFTHPGLIEKARVEFERRRGPDFRYKPVLGDRAPPLDYRAGVPGGGAE
jgi:aminobenzoyl-glutamate utilization protein B